MTTLRQVTRLVRPLLERHPDLEQVGRWVFLKPVRHVARAILIERISDASHFRIQWAVVHLCEVHERFPLNWATMLKPIPEWSWDNPTLQEDVIAAVEDQALGPMRAIETLDDFVAFASSETRFHLTDFGHYLLKVAPVDAARGDMGGARRACAELLTGRTKWSMALMRPEFERITGELCPLLASGDWVALARLLHAWEAEMVANLKIAHIYEPTPFPFEVQTGGA